VDRASVDRSFIIPGQRIENRAIFCSPVSRARGNERRKSRANSLKGSDAVPDFSQLLRGRLSDTAYVTLPGESEQLLDFAEREPERLGATDEAKPGELQLAVSPVS